MSDTIPIILLPGMSADERLFAPQIAAFPNIVVPAWIPPRAGESLRAYARRLAPEIDPGRPCIVGGASFGGIIALELTRHMQAATRCILIGSARSPVGLPHSVRRLGVLARLGPGAIQAAAKAVSRWGRPLVAAKMLRQMERLARPEARFARWAMCAVLAWRPSPEPATARVFHIHGEADHIFPAALAPADVIVPGGRHALSLSHPAAVNQFIAEVLRQADAEHCRLAAITDRR